jgi:hypothetical protein
MLDKTEHEWLILLACGKIISKDREKQEAEAKRSR